MQLNSTIIVSEDSNVTQEVSAFQIIENEIAKQNQRFNVFNNAVNEKTFSDVMANVVIETTRPATWLPIWKVRDQGINLNALYQAAVEHKDTDVGEAIKAVVAKFENPHYD